MEKRISWDEYYIEIVEKIKLRATCPRKQVGAILVKNNEIIGTGYNGAPKGFDHCTEIGCMMQTLADGKQHCLRSIHAEVNALLQAGEKAEGSTLYITTMPCPYCFKLIIQSRVKKVIYSEEYNKKDSEYWYLNSEVEIEQWNKQ